MKKNITEIVFILDRSGSMSGLEKDTIGGFNSMIRQQKEEEGEAYVTTVLFGSDIKTIHDRIPIDKVNPLTEKEYSVYGCTALLDAIGETIQHISTIHKYARPEDVPTSTIFAITTDGMENASRKFSSKQVKKMIKHKKAEGWEFLFVAANIDAVETASNIGIGKDRSVNYHADKKGTGVVYEALNKAVRCMRSEARMPADWSEEISDDYASR